MAASVVGAALVLSLLIPEARAEDKVDFTTTLYQEQRRGGLGGLRVTHPQFDFGVDIGEKTSLEAGYAADIVSGATAGVYSSDAAGDPLGDPEADAVSQATEFSDVRHEGHIGLGFAGSRSSLGFTVGTAAERDYLSMSVGAGGAITLPGKNTTLALSYNRNFDEVCDRDNAEAGPLERIPLTGADPCNKDFSYNKLLYGVDQDGLTVWQDLTIDTAQASMTQNLSPTAVMQIGVFGQVLKGFQSNPYRRVRLGDVRMGSAVYEPQELVPDVRARLSLTARFNFFVKPIRGAVHMMARGYSDTWGVNSGTAELGYSQYLGRSLLWRTRARVYQQSAASFFKDAFYYQTEYPAGTYFTGDRELGSIRNVVVGTKLSLISVGKDGKDVWGLFNKLQFNLKADVLFLDELPTGDLANNRDGIDYQFLSSGQLLDAFVLQLGLLLQY